MKLQTGEINWDFGHDGRLDGFREWFLWEFASGGTGDCPEFRDKKVLEAVFQHAVLKGIIYKPFLRLQDDLYYLQNSNAVK